VAKNVRGSCSEESRTRRDDGKIELEALLLERQELREKGERFERKKMCSQGKGEIDGKGEN